MKICFIAWDSFNRSISFIGEDKFYDDYDEIQCVYPDEHCIFDSRDVSPLWGEIAEHGGKEIPVPAFLGKLLGCINKLWNKIPLKFRNKKAWKLYEENNIGIC